MILAPPLQPQSTDECTVILGDMLEVWTNGLLKATRVRPPNLRFPVHSSCFEPAR